MFYRVLIKLFILDSLPLSFIAVIIRQVLSIYGRRLATFVISAIMVRNPNSSMKEGGKYFEL